MKSKKNKKVVQPTEASVRVYVEYKEYRTGGDAINPDDQGSSRTVENIKVNFIRLHREQPRNCFFNHSIELSNKDMLKLDRLFLAVVRYGTGNTFGRADGAWHIVGVAPTYKIADLMLEEALKSTTGYKPWEGYFEHFQDREIHEVSLV